MQYIRLIRQYSPESFSNKPYIQALTNWTPVKNRVLYITGLSGSGKTTISHDYAKRYNAVLFPLDDMESIITDKYELDFLNKLSFEAFCDLFLDTVLLELPPKGRVIVEGVQLLFLNWERIQLKTQPLIILSTGYIQSTWRAATRDKFKYMSVFKDNLACSIQLKKLKEYLNETSGLEAFTGRPYTPIPYLKYPGFFEIPGYSGYAANPEGEILNKRLGNHTKGGVGGSYRRISAYADGAKSPRLCYAHDLVCRAFYGPPQPGYVVLHRDNNKLNTAASNLSWGTQSQNITDMWADGLRDKKRVGVESFPLSSNW
jgi:cytidylate kinase